MQADKSFSRGIWGDSDLSNVEEHCGERRAGWGPGSGFETAFMPVCMKKWCKETNKKGKQPKNRLNIHELPHLQPACRRHDGRLPTLSFNVADCG
jgi:hypothetical protein